MYIEEHPQLSLSAYSSNTPYCIGDIIEEITSKRKYIISMIPDTSNSYLHVGVLPLWEKPKQLRNESLSSCVLLRVSAIKKYQPTRQEQEVYYMDMIDGSLDTRDEESFRLFSKKLEDLRRGIE